jgi:tRNA pseudouridine38-40 synthase
MMIILLTMRKVKLLVEYDGTDFHGWQTQRNKPTIQTTLEEALLRITGKNSNVIGASRTDAGVHAFGQVAAFRTHSSLEAETIQKALNALLPYDIRILEVTDVNDAFHPRYDAIKKSYLYIIANQRSSSAFLFRYTWTVQYKLKRALMKEAAQVLVGTHDFSAFQGAGSGIKDPERKIFSCSIKELKSLYFMTTRFNGNFIQIRIEANGFLRHMVRNIVGTLVEIGRGRMSSEQMRDILESRDRRQAGPTAPANGLFLEKIVY